MVQPEPYNQRRYLLGRIAGAFADVTLGDGVSIHQTVVLDDYGDDGDGQLRQARLRDRTDNWRAVVDDPDFQRISGIRT